MLAAITPDPANVCVGGTGTLTDATPGGAWSSLDPSIATINASGVVTGVSAGTATIQYTITPSCGTPLWVTSTVNVNDPPSATISYTGGPFCTTVAPVAVNQTGTAGGTYSYTGAGTLALAADGTIDPGASTGGTYTVTYTIAASGGCAVYTTTTTVTITAAPSATISYAGTPYCTSAGTVNVTRTGTAGGVFTASPAGLSLNAGTGAITTGTSTPGTYTVTYTIAAAGGCALFATTTTVDITAAASATISYAGGPFCKTLNNVAVTLTGAAGGTFSAPAALSINGATGAINPSASTVGTYAVTYGIAASGGCAAFNTTTSVTITAAPTAVAGPDIQTCSNSGAINITGGSSATNQSSVLWTSSGTAGTIANATSLTTATYTPSAADIAAGSVTLTLTANGNGNCAAATSTKIVTISGPTAIASVTASPATICLGGSSNLFIPATTVSLLSENFEGATNSFAVVNGTPFTNIPLSQWTKRASPYTYNNGSGTNVTFNSGSPNFMLTNSDDPSGDPNYVYTSLVSPSISTIGYTALNFSYTEHIIGELLEM